MLFFIQTSWLYRVVEHVLFTSILHYLQVGMVVMFYNLIFRCTCSCTCPATCTCPGVCHSSVQGCCAAGFHCWGISSIK